MSEVDEIIKRYILLVLALAEHNPDFLDTYYGPDSIRKEAKRKGKVDLDILLREAQELTSQIQELEEIEAERKEYLHAQLRAMETTIRMQLGEKMTIEEKVENIYGFKPERVDESEFEEAYRLLDVCLPGKGSIAERSHVYEAEMRIPVENLENLCNFVLKELRERTRQRFGLPDGENVEIRLVNDRPFTAACYFRGGSHSTLELNTDAPFFYLHYLTILMAHELYPGHHTEFCLKEVNLIQKLGHQEFCVVPSLSPQIFMAEMIATHAQRMIMTDDEFGEWFRHQLVPKSKLNLVDIGEPLQIMEAQRMLASVSMNAVFMYWDDRAGEEAIKEYIKQYRHSTKEETAQSVRVLTHPIYHVYTFSYYPSYRLLEEVLSRSSDPYQLFGRLLREAPLPSTILSW